MAVLPLGPICIAEIMEGNHYSRQAQVISEPRNCNREDLLERYAYCLAFFLYCLYLMLNIY